MNAELMKRLGERSDLYPQRLEAGFPHVVKRIADLWGRDELDRYFAALVFVDAVPRQGFPLDVAAEILVLQNYYRDIRAPEPQAADEWITAPDVERHSARRLDGQ